MELPELGISVISGIVVVSVATAAVFLLTRDGDSMNFLRRIFSGKKSRSSAKMPSHVKARCSQYPRSEVVRFEVRDIEVDWDADFPQYKPVDFTSPSVAKGPVWADPDYRDPKVAQPKWNALDGGINRCSHTGKYKIIDGIPRNPVGRTGLKGRGLLGKWGPNHAADPIVSRWKRDSSGKVVTDSQGKPILQFVAIQRRDTGEWAVPGGMVDAGEVVSETLRREFGEEAMNSLECSEKEKKDILKSVKDLFSKGVEVYRGYVDDPRNTDNAWMETVAMNFHDETGKSVGKINLCAGDDAVGVKWMDISSKLMLYASHVEFIEKCVKNLHASW